MGKKTRAAWGSTLIRLCTWKKIRADVSLRNAYVVRHVELKFYAKFRILIAAKVLRGAMAYFLIIIHDGWADREKGRGRFAREIISF